MIRVLRRKAVIIMNTNLSGGLETSPWWREVRERADTALRQAGYDDWSVEIRPMTDADAEQIDSSGADDDDVGATIDLGELRLSLLIPANFDPATEDADEFVEFSIVELIDRTADDDSDDDDE